MVKVKLLKYIRDLLKIEYSVLALVSLFLVFKYRIYFSSKLVPSVDMQGHIYIVDRLIESLFSGQLFFYDPAWFSGWPAFSFYGFLPHLIAAIFGLFLSFFTSEPARLAVQSLTAFSCSLLPFSIYYFANSISETNSSSKNKLRSLLLAILAFSSSFWFLNHDGQWYGIGAAAPLHIGLFSQVFGWHFLLLYLASLIRLIRFPETSRYFCFTSIFFLLLLVSHSLTAVYGAAIGFFIFLCFEPRKKIFLAHLFSILISSFWLLPFLSWSKTYTAMDIFQPSGDFLKLFFRYPLSSILENYKQFFSLNPETALNPAPVFFAIIVIFSLISKKSKENKFYFKMLAFIAFTVVIFSSPYIASSIPLGLHYYRFNAYSFLLLTALLCWPAANLISGKNKKTEFFYFALVSLLSFWIVLSTHFLPHVEIARISKLHHSSEYLKNEKEVLRVLKTIKPKGRIFLEYFDDYQKYPFLSAHFLTSRIYKETSREVLNGLFLQSALAYRMPVASFNMLGARTYNTPLLFTDRANLNFETKINNLKKFGVSHLIIGNEKFASHLIERGLRDSIKVGRYFIISIENNNLALINSLSKPLVGFIDQTNGEMPFELLQFFLYSRQQYQNSFELIKFNSVKDVPKEVKYVVINQKSSSEIPSINKEFLYLDFKEKRSFNHYEPRYQKNFQLDKYVEIEAYLSEKAEFKKFINKLQQAPSAPSIKKAKFSWKVYGKTIKLENLKPGEFYSLNYSYFPKWQSKDAKVYRGFGERIVIQAKKESAEISYSLTRINYLGYLISAAALFGLFWISGFLKARRDIFNFSFNSQYD